MASASTSTSTSTSTAVSSPTDSCRYQIFLNHRGPDTKKTFTSHLYHRLVLHGFRVFWDKEEMQVGDTLRDQIHDAIKAASLHVAVFSSRYAESTWCLRELLLMLESKKPIIPVFYRVHPTDLRRTQGEGEGVYAQALRNLEPRYEPTAIKNWRTALSSVAEISGLELDRFNGDEGELLDKVVDSVLKKLGRTRLNVAEHPTGLDKKIEDFEKKVLSVQLEQSGKPQVVGIVGFGGIGKTTLVKELFNRKSSQYHKSCFLSDIRETARTDSLKSLQKELLKGLTQTDQNIESVSQGIELLKTRLSSSKALVILDDVDNISQLDALLGPIRDVLHPHSLILITSRDKALLRTSKVEESSIYKLTGLDTQHSQELFCMHAFSQGHPLPGFEDLVGRYLKACDGLPLSLKVNAAFLYENESSIWEDHLTRLEEILPKEIEKSLQISYDALQRDEKHIFLDIACFFIGKNRDTAIRIWDGSGWRGSLGFRSLQNKNLVEVDIANNIRMHDHLRDLGRNLAQSPELPRRIWRTEDFEDLLQQSCDTDVRGISIRWTKREKPSFARCKIRNLQLLDIDSQFWNRDKSIRRSGWSYLNLPFKKLGKLREKHLLDCVKNAVQPSNLIWFRWHSDQRSSPPSWIPMNKLRVLEVSGWKLKTLWPEKSQAPLQLRQLTVPYSAITSLPQSLENLTNLEHIQLSSNHIYSLPDSLGTLTRLRYLDFERCSSFTSKTLGTMCTLEHLSLSLFESIGNIGELKNLKCLNLESCGRLESLPDSLGQLNQLTELRLHSLIGLREVSFKMVEGERESINCPNVQHLQIRNCGQLVEVGTLPDALTTLELTWCNQLVEVGTLPDALTTLNLTGCGRLESLPDSLGQLNQLTELRLHDLGLREVSFKMVEGERESINCPNLQHLQINFCSQLVEVGTLPDALTTLKLSYCTQLRKIEWASPLSKLRVLNLQHCYSVEQLPSLETLVSLEELHTSYCRKLRSITGLAHLRELRTTHLRELRYRCRGLEEDEGVEEQC